MSSLSPEAAKVFKQLWNARQLSNALGSPAMLYLLAVIMGLNRQEAITIFLYLAPISSTVLTIIVPYLATRRAVQRAFDVPEDTPPQVRLERILRIPGNVVVTIFATFVPGVTFIVGAAVVLFGRDPWLVVWSLVATGMHLALLMVMEQYQMERILGPYAVEQFHRAGTVTLKGGGFMWPRQAWFLPYTLALFVACTLAMTLTIIGRQSYDTYTELLAKSSTIGTAEVQPLIQEMITKLVRDSVIPITILGGYLLVIAGMTAWVLARRQREGAMSIQDALVGLASGQPRLPNWISTDEIGDLSAATARVFEQLRSFSMSLRDSALSLQDSAQQLGASTTKQTEVLSVQASALQETQVTTEEITQTSQLAAKTANNILKQAEKAQDISQSGEAAIQEGMAGLSEIGAQVREMATSIKSLDEQARQIARITSMVKDLADQSNMLALNAAIEAVRSGESGKGFGVVAKEIRSLADQSIRATHSIRSILQGIGTAIASAATLTEKGTKRVESSLAQIQSFSQQVQQLSAIVRDNANSVRQIAAAVTQQDAGIVQITQAVTDMTRIMDQTMTQLRASEEAIDVVREVAQQVTGFVGQYGWMEDGTAKQPGDITAATKPAAV